nr:MAG TPA: hypothetical protein [Bacteriophage sp.]
MYTIHIITHHFQIFNCQCTFWEHSPENPCCRNRTGSQRHQAHGKQKSAAGSDPACILCGG